MANISGSCLCGSVKYRSDADPIATAVCHCKDCQRQTGTSCSVVVLVPQDSFQVEGETASVKTVGDDHGQEADRRFCPDCGSPIVTFSPGAAAGVAIIKAGTLDDTSWLEPTIHVWTESAQPWMSTGEAQAFPRGLPAG